MVRLPAEWEEQDGVLVAWPHEKTDWHPYLSAVEPIFIQIIKEISRRERVVVVVPETGPAARKLRDAAAVMERIVLCTLETNDTWSRDFGPITVLDGGEPLLLDFGFNGWGLKFAADKDNQVSRRLHGKGIFGRNRLKTEGLVLEGGSIESDGHGTILTTAECLLNANRNPHLAKWELEAALGGLLGAEHFLWLENGYLAGDDTDSHVDTLARICPDDTIAYVRCDDPTDEHYPALQALEEELTRFRTRDDRPYRLIPLPWPESKFDEEGERLPATYANFLVINQAVLVPTYGDKSDNTALTAISTAFPRHEIIGIDCLPLILQHGSLHCVTMQLPKGTLKQYGSGE
ncbi:agmatine deiminase family protein [Geotalea sp. SG265]|uniref:agmatine deiminase family protein n=1 Tax=Geotalea sp. SG265 TaxID=2922867 RepID=UPI001FAF7794|nr:agmatine deiminase family protein [Geotalea sp. SG265]